MNVDGKSVTLSPSLQWVPFSLSLYPWWLTMGSCHRRTERDVTDWSTNKLKGLLMGVRVEGDQGTCEVTAVDSLEGEASINNRKGKLIHFYEWHVKATWTGEFQTRDAHVKTLVVCTCISNYLSQHAQCPNVTSVILHCPDVHLTLGLLTCMMAYVWLAWVLMMLFGILKLASLLCCSKKHKTRKQY